MYSGPQAFAGQGELIFFQFAECHFLFLGQGMVGTHDDRQMVVEEDVRFDLFVTACGFEGQYEIHFALDKHLHQFRHGLIENVQFHFGVQFHESQHRFRQNRAERIGHADVQCAGEQLLQVAYMFFARVGGIQGFFGVWQKFRSGFGQRHFMAVALEELYVQLGFQLSDLLG